MAEVCLKNVCKSYDGAKLVVDDFSMAIKEKEFVVLVGPSGCGKSTTLRMIAGLEEITAGEIYIDGQLVNNIPPKERDIAMVFQNYALFPYLTVYENMAFGLNLRKESKANIRKKVYDAAEILGISHILQRKPRALSGGQRQRVAIGRAIVRQAKLFLMDEPLSNLDAKLRNQMRAELIKLREQIDTTFIYVTHDQTEAMTLGDRIVVMNEGHIMQIGTPREVFQQPTNSFVAGFIGTPQMNFFVVSLSGVDKDKVMLDGKPIDLPKQVIENIVAEKQFLLGIRPERIEIAAAQKSQLTAEIDFCEILGNTVHLHVFLGDGQKAIVTSGIAEWRNIADKRIGLRLPPESLYLFSKNSGLELLHNK